MDSVNLFIFPFFQLTQLRSEVVLPLNYHPIDVTLLRASVESS